MCFQFEMRLLQA